MGESCDIMLMRHLTDWYLAYVRVNVTKFSAHILFWFLIFIYHSFTPFVCLDISLQTRKNIFQNIYWRAWDEVDSFSVDRMIFVDLLQKASMYI